MAGCYELALLNSVPKNIRAVHAHASLRAVHMPRVYPFKRTHARAHTNRGIHTATKQHVV